MRGLLAMVLLLVGACNDRGHAKGDRHEHGKGSTAGHADVVELTPAAAKLVGIKIGTAERRTLTSGPIVPAELQLNPDRSAHITPIVSGRIDKVHATLGQAVKEGQPLATLSSVSLGQARGTIAQAQASVGLAKAAFERQQTMRKEGIGSQRSYLEAQATLRRAMTELRVAKERLRVYGQGGGKGSRLTIRSPLAGTIIERHATPGEVVSGERPIFRVADLSRVWAIGRVYEQDVRYVKRGAKAELTLDAYPKRVWTGAVSYVAHTLNPQTRTLAVRVVFDNADGTLKAGLFGQLRLAGPSDSAACVVAENAVQQVAEGNVVFLPVEGKQHTYKPVGVKVGQRRGGWVSVIDGLKPGQRIVTHGAFTLKSELLKAQLGEGHAH
ncbi:MAG: efflux RND transporter periplasmic adaptor subunit [Deltaproteobacteria bacterium]|nr:efflux RND transporter periplasmic adaptor subunit [Deltaproteobacteria bacterium]